MKNLKLEEEKVSIQPDWKESDFAKTIHGQIMLMLEKAIENKHLIEAQVLSWSVIEQLLLPRLIAWIAKILKINLPKEIFKLNAQNVNFLYLCISHDEKLYKKLEENRKQRNKITHRLISLGNIDLINKLAKSCVESSILLQQEIVKRFTGESLIPSINLYRNGWNDCRTESVKRIKELFNKYKN